jgi:hypothetical protein
LSRTSGGCTDDVFSTVSNGIGDMEHGLMADIRDVLLHGFCELLRCACLRHDSQQSSDKADPDIIQNPGVLF